MGSWLSDVIKPCCNQLHAMETALATVQIRYLYWNEDYTKIADTLVNNKQYQGVGAISFLQAVNTDTNSSRIVCDGIGHVSTACNTFEQSMTMSSAMSDQKMSSLMPPSGPDPYLWHLSPDTYANWRDQLVQAILDNAGGGNPAELLNRIFTDGKGCMYGAAMTARKAVESLVLEDATFQGANSSGVDIHTLSNPAQFELKQAQMLQAIHDFFLNAFHSLADEIEYDLMYWADGLWCDYQNFQIAMRDSESYLSARDLFDIIYAHGIQGTQSTLSPITITPYKTKDGKNGLLITIGGTDISHMGWDTNLFTALATGQGYSNPLFDDVRQAITNYMVRHPEMAGSLITLAGYSLGGMTAQQVANDITSNKNSPLSNYHLQLSQVITYGAPVMGPPLKGVQYSMYDATYDPVPLLSSYENPQLNNIDSPLHPGTMLVDMIDPSYSFKQYYALKTGLGNIITTQPLPWDARLHSYIDPKGQYGSQIHNISDVGNTILGNSKMPGAIPVLENHMEYDLSNQLNSVSTAPDINPTSLGPTEYFKMQNTNNLVAQLNTPIPVQPPPGQFVPPIGRHA